MGQEEATGIAESIEERNGDGKVFYTCLGHPDDFKNEAFNNMVKIAVIWSLMK